MTPLLSWLYVPGDRPDRFDKAIAAAPSAVVIDLEDAVDPDSKVRARQHLADFMDRAAPGGPQLHVRINALHTPWASDDLSAIAKLERVDAIRVPKVESVADIDRVLEHSNPDCQLYCLIESARGLRSIQAIASDPRVSAIALGEQDLAAELSVTAPNAIDQIRLSAVLAAAAAGLPPVPVSVYPNVRDDKGFLSSCRAAKSLGMFGRSAIHPRQLPLISRAFRPTEPEMAWATQVDQAAVKAASVGTGAVTLPNGDFVDAPIVARARRILQLAAQLESMVGQ